MKRSTAQMKHLFSITALIIVLMAFGHSSYAQIRKIPAEVTTTFTNKYPDAKEVEWKDKLTGFSAGFKEDDISYLASFDNKGNWLNTEHTISKDELPEAVTDGFEKSKYAEWEIQLVDYIEQADSAIQYRILIGKGDIKKRNLLFSSNGRLLKDKLTL